MGDVSLPLVDQSSRYFSLTGKKNNDQLYSSFLLTSRWNSVNFVLALRRAFLRFYRIPYLEMDIFIDCYGRHTMHCVMTHRITNI